MEKTDYADSIHLGRKIERVRRLRGGMTQAELGELLGITKQAISKMEQTERFQDERLKEIASALGGVTVEGLKNTTKKRFCIIRTTFMRTVVSKQVLLVTTTPSIIFRLIKQLSYLKSF